MVQKQAAYSRGPAGDDFADDDPLAELARLVGYEAPVVRHGELKEARPASPEPRHIETAPIETVDLQDELLQEVDDFQLPSEPHSGGTAHAAPTYTAEVYSPAYEPVSFGGGQPAYGDEPQGHGHFGADHSDAGGLASELEWSVGDVAPEPQAQARSGGADPADGYGRYRLPLANFNSVRSTAAPQPREEPRFEPAPAAQPEPHAPVHHAYAPEPEFVPEPAAEPEQDFDFGFSPQDHHAAEAAAPIHLDTVPVRETSALVYPEAPVAPVRREVPSFFEELARSEAPEPVARSVTMPAAAPAYTAPQAASAPAAQDEDLDLFGDGFELELDDIELDLSDLNVKPEAAPQPAPAEPAPAVHAAPQPVTQAAPVAAHHPAPAAPHADQHLPFDATEIADQDDHLETLAHLEVPELPPVEDEVVPVNFNQEFDFDIDAELATLLDQKVEQAPQRSQPAPAAVPPQAVAATAAAAGVAAAAVPPMAAQVRNMPSEDFDVFEKALEEDFRRSLDGPHSFGGRPQGAVAVPVEEMKADDEDYEDDQPTSRRWMVAAAAAVLVVVGAGGVLAWKYGGAGEGLGGGEPKIVMADKAPVKVVPQDPGGKSVPNQDKAVYDRVAGAASDQPKQKSLISSDEEPMDVAQRTLEPDNLPMENEAEADANAADNPPAGAGNPQQTANAQSGQPGDNAQSNPGLQPRKVKTMIVRPDGSLVAQDSDAPATANTTQASVQQPAAQPPQPALSAPSAQQPAPVNQPVPTPRPTVQTAAAKPAAQPAPAAAKPAAPAPATAQPQAAATQTASASAGGYVVQISSLPTEADARKSYQNLSAKYGSIIGGKGVDIKAADIPGKGTYYRVRIPAGGKDAAVSMCERYRAAGGTCMVTR
ncbi:SPOR domain-containing protein [Rhizobium paknamense]|uniref:SPOR domain-containing protein n=1 Tax=Rhizobium paknamense TaxID=1206817 RepID=A0ABU0IG25_9HYPH|nr:SPOR domain-containing protein [Rhizobium paknamense]MDQ0457199.1 hypothetical protein [Rhizobium paknamense]